MNKYSRNNRPVNILPLIDVIFLILAIFFYLMLSMVRHEGMKVNLPSASSTQVELQTFVSISITESNDLYINKNSTSWSVIDNALNQLKKEMGRDLVIYISADKRSEFDYFVKLMDALRTQEITNVTIEISDT
jgi:biopolymer transport protein ExbD